VYVEKLASAVDFIIDNIGNFAEAPASTDERVAIIKEAISRDRSTGRFVSDGTPTLAETTSVDAPQVEEPPTNVTDISEKLRERLRERISAKQEVEAEQTQKDESASQANKELLQNVLGKLKELKSEKPDEGDSGDNENFYSGSSEDHVSEEDIFDAGETAPSAEEDSTENIEVDGEAAVKAASAGQSLAEVLNAALSSDEQLGESASQGAETGEVHGSEGPMARQQATDNLKKKLLAKIGKEA